MIYGLSDGGQAPVYRSLCVLCLSRRVSMPIGYGTHLDYTFFMSLVLELCGRWLVYTPRLSFLYVSRTGTVWSLVRVHTSTILSPCLSYWNCVVVGQGTHLDYTLFMSLVLELCCRWLWYAPRLCFLYVSRTGTMWSLVMVHISTMLSLCFSYWNCVVVGQGTQLDYPFIMSLVLELCGRWLGYTHHYPFFMSLLLELCGRWLGYTPRLCFLYVSRTGTVLSLVRLHTSTMLSLCLFYWNCMVVGQGTHLDYAFFVSLLLELCGVMDNGFIVPPLCHTVHLRSDVPEYESV